MMYYTTLLRLNVTPKALQFLFFFSFFFLFIVLVSVFGGTAKYFLVTKKACDRDLTYSLDTQKHIVPQVDIRDACGTWHSLLEVTSNHSIQKRYKNSQKLRNYLASG